MTDRRTEDYAFQNGLSNRQAKKKLRRKKKHRSMFTIPVRGMPIAGTGKPKGA